MNRSAIDLAASPRTFTASRLQQWQRRMRQANASREAGQRVAARVHCRHALRIALELIERPSGERIDDCIAALVISHLNLADVHADGGAFDAALRQRCAAHEHLIRLVMGDDAIVQQAALRHSRYTHAALIEHLARHGDHALAARALQAGLLALSAGHPTLH